MPDGRATQPRYVLRPHPRNYITFQRKRLADFTDDLLALASQVEGQQPVPELSEDTATPLNSDTEGNSVGRRTKGKRRWLQL